MSSSTASTTTSRLPLPHLALRIRARRGHWAPQRIVPGSQPPIKLFSSDATLALRSIVRESLMVIRIVRFILAWPLLSSSHSLSEISRPTPSLS
ncbi:hypothetical protein O181_036212 [Austropuccinia psidii MF-1]|uniref:Uncharacterized protein n=1 Tax=Austropuccinia psidii MF-1 TaxID=1389203 RepID=A0A9Q3H9P9_9BASI|nr:hypothetical protein [Austropuccinia psidii MF-1]